MASDAITNDITIHDTLTHDILAGIAITHDVLTRYMITRDVLTCVLCYIYCCVPLNPGLQPHSMVFTVGTHSSAFSPQGLDAQRFTCQGIKTTLVLLIRKVGMIMHPTPVTLCQDVLCMINASLVHLYSCFANFFH